jgi:hypothetical protein
MGTWRRTRAQYVKFRGSSKYGRLQRESFREENHPSPPSSQAEGLEYLR